MTHCLFEATQATHQRGRVSAKVRYGPGQLVLDVPDNEVLPVWAAHPHKQQVASVVFFAANGGQPVETLRLPGAYCIRYHEQFNSSDVSGGSYQCTLTLSDPTGWTIQAGGPARAYVAPAARSYAGVGTTEAIGIGGVMGGAPAPVPPVPPAAWEAAAGPRVAIGEEVAREWLLKNAALLTAAATVKVARPAIEEATTARTVTPNKLRPKTSAAMLLADGTILTASSQRGLPDGVEMPPNLLQEVIEVLGKVPVKERGVGHGMCAEPQIISQAIRAEKSLKGAKSLAMLVRAESHEDYRLPICACGSCRFLLAHYQIIDVVERPADPSL